MTLMWLKSAFRAFSKPRSGPPPEVLAHEALLDLECWRHLDEQYYRSQCRDVDVADSRSPNPRSP